MAAKQRHVLHVRAEKNVESVPDDWHRTDRGIKESIDEHPGDEPARCPKSLCFPDQIGGDQPCDHITGDWHEADDAVEPEADRRSWDHERAIHKLGERFEPSERLLRLRIERDSRALHRCSFQRPSRLRVHGRNSFPLTSVSQTKAQPQGGSVSGFLWILVVGLFAGVIARFLLPGPNNPQGFVVTAALGIAGAFVSTWLGQSIGWYRPDQGAGFVGATVGALIVLFIWHRLAVQRVVNDPGVNRTDWPRRT